jgi:two-component system LytT family response regulator
MKIKAILIDDEPYNVLNLRNMLTAYEGIIEIVGEASGVDQAYQLILDLRPQLLFLDIQMPHKNGFDLLTSLDPKQLQALEVIFVTAYDAYGIQAIKFSALDYLLKPIQKEELDHALQKAQYRILEKKKNEQLQTLVEQWTEDRHQNPSKIALNTLKENHLVEIADIVRLESSNNYTTFILKKGRSIMVSKPIYEYEHMLQNRGFIRCHQSHLVNEVHIQSVLHEDGGYLRLSNGDKIPISRLRKGEVKEKLGLH